MRGTLNNGTAVIDWLEFFDPQNPEQKYKVNVSLILSGYGCIYGAGCPGLLNRGVQPDVGCCERGVTFTDEADFDNVKRNVALLTEDDWDNIDHGLNKG